MPLSLLLHSARSPLNNLLQLKRVLPDALVKATTVLETDAVEEMPDVPRTIAFLDADSDEDVTAVKNAVSSLSASDLEVQEGPVQFLPPPDPADDGIINDPAFYGCTADELARIDQKVASLAAQVTRIVEAKPSGIPFPETQYTDDKQAAYETLCRLLPAIPMQDKGAILRPNDVNNLRGKKPDSIAVNAWNEVVDHLELEVRFFQYEREWFFINGYMRSALRDQVIFDYSFVDFLNNKYLQLKEDTTVSILLNVCMSLANRLVGKIPEYGEASAAVLSALWTITKGSMTHPSGTITAEISKVKQDIGDSFHNTIQKLETTDKNVSGDWGLLNDFGTLVHDGSLRWPRDLSPVRCACAQAFQLQTMKSLLYLKDHGSWVRTFGVVQMQRSSAKPRKRVWRHKGNYHLYTHSEPHKTCFGTKNYFYECYLGERIIQPAPPHGQARTDYLEASDELQAKLFGDKTQSETDPQLNLPPGFLIYPSKAPRKGWKLPQMKGIE